MGFRGSAVRIRSSCRKHAERGGTWCAIPSCGIMRLPWAEVGASSTLRLRRFRALGATRRTSGTLALLRPHTACHPTATCARSIPLTQNRRSADSAHDRSWRDCGYHDAPSFSQEMVFAAWLIMRGFGVSAPEAGGQAPVSGALSDRRRQSIQPKSSFHE